MKKKEIDIWFKYQKALKNEEYFEPEDKREFLRINFLIMEEAHKIHNDNMLNIL